MTITPHTHTGRKGFKTMTEMKINFTKSMTIDFAKSYSELSPEARHMLSEQDFDEIKNMLCYKNMLTESIKKKAAGHNSIKKPVNISRAISLVNNWRQALRKSSPESCEHWIRIIQNSDKPCIEMQVVKNDENNPMTFRCAGYSTLEIIKFIKTIYMDGSYIKSIRM